MRSRLLPLFVLLLGLTLSAARLQAQLYWDINGPTAGAGGTAPAGTWGAGNFWSSSATGAATTSSWSDGSVAVFSAGTDATGSYTVTVSGTQTIGGLTVQEGTPTLSGGTVSFTAVTNFNLTSDATIASVLTGTGGNLFKSGSGALTLSGINTYTGGTHLNAGTLNLTGSISHAAEDFIVNSNTVPTATLNITAGGDLTADRLRIGVTDNTFSGAVNVSGVGSTVTNTNYLYVGEAGAGSLNILSGATVASVYTSIGNNANGIGNVTLSGSGSTLSNTETLYVGGGGDGTLVVENGATVTNKVGIVGNNPVSGASGYAQVTGSGSSWTSTDSLVVGAATTGDLEITDQGSVTTFNAIIGGQASVNGSIFVSDSGSALNATNDVVVGHNGSGSLVIIDGGAVTTGHQAIIANNSGSSGTAQLVGAGSAWTIAGDLYVGNAGNGLFRTYGNSTVNVGGGTGTIHLGHSSGGNGILQIGYDGEGYNPGSALNAAAITTGSGGTGSVLLATSATESNPYYLTTTGDSSGDAVVISGATQLQQVNGYNIIYSNNTYTGGTTVTGGTLQAAHENAFGTGPVTVSGNGRVAVNEYFVHATVNATGGGRVTGIYGGYYNATIGINGVLAPGVSATGSSAIASLFFEDLTLGQSGVFEINVASDGDGGFHFDQASVQNSSTLTINATPANRFSLKVISMDANFALGTLDGLVAGTTYSWLIFDTNGIYDITSNGPTITPESFLIDLSQFSSTLSGSFSLSQTGNDIYLNFAAVPEPSTYALLATGVVTFWIARRRRRSSAS